MLLASTLAMILPFALIFLNSSIAKKSMNDREKLTSFECGFDPLSKARLPFSLRFFLIAVVFLIFDVEITLILPMPILTHSNNILMIVGLAIVFMLILILGLYHEWNQGALEWK